MLIIRPPVSQTEQIEACKMVEKVYRKHGYCDFLESNQFNHAMLIAVNDEEIVGTVGLQHAVGQKLLIEHYFGFISEENFSYKRPEIVEICKLASTGGNDLLIFKSLILALFEYIQTTDQAIKLVYACIKPALLKAIEKYLHIPVYPLKFDIVEKNIEEIYTGYFLTAPRPIPVTFKMQDVNGYFSRIKEELVGKVHIELQGFNHKRKPVLNG